ncbi:MAG: hypothetical protein ABIV47_00125 [Roseiflexaceae bacterium]
MTTSSFNPILRHEAIVSWNPFVPHPQPEPGVAIVLVHKGQPSLTLLPDDPLTRSMLKWRQYKWAFWIDTSEQNFLLQCRLPSKDPGLDFQASAYITYKVTDPVAILRRRISNARAIVEPPLLRLLRRESRQYTLDQCPKAEQTIRTVVKTQLRQGDIAITRCIVTLDVEEEERAHARTLRAADRHYAHSLRHVTYRSHLDELEVPLARKQIEFYREIAKTGDLQILWLYLTTNRDDIQTVLKGFNEQRQLDREHWLHVLKELRTDGGIEALHLDHLRTSVLDRLAEIERQSNTPAALSSGNSSTNASGGPLSPGGSPAGSGPAGGPMTNLSSSAIAPTAVSPPSATQPASTAAQLPLKERAVGDPNNPTMIP